MYPLGKSVYQYNMSKLAIFFLNKKKHIHILIRDLEPIYIDKINSQWPQSKLTKLLIHSVINCLFICPVHFKSLNATTCSLSHLSALFCLLLSLSFFLVFLTFLNDYNELLSLFFPFYFTFFSFLLCFVVFFSFIRFLSVILPTLLLVSHIFVYYTR